jgi:hypothetical protein
MVFCGAIIGFKIWVFLSSMNFSGSFFRAQVAVCWGIGMDGMGDM